MKILQPIFIRLISSLLIVTVLLGILSGCFKKEEKKTEKPEKIELVYYKLFDDEDIMVPLIQQYQAMHPNVSIRYRKFVNQKEYEDLIINELAEGEGPDMFSVPNYWFLRNAKKISPLPNDLMTLKQFEETFVAVAKNDLILRDANDGKSRIFGIPLTIETLALYYNKASYEDKIPSRGAPGTTWEQLKDDVSKLTKPSNDFEKFELAGIAMGRSDNIARAVDVLYLLMLQYKTKFYNQNISRADFSKQTSITATGTSLNPATEALKLYTSFGLPSNKHYSWNKYIVTNQMPSKEVEAFAKGKVAMIFGYSYLYEDIRNIIEDLKQKGIKTIDPKNIKIAPVPQINDPKISTDKRDAYANYHAETVSRTSAHPKEAWEFLLFLSSKKNLQYYNEKTHHPSSRRDLIEEQKADPVYGVFSEQTGYSESFPIYDYQSYNEIFSKAIDDVIATIPPKDAIRIAEDNINELLPDAGLIPPVQKKEQ